MLGGKCARCGSTEDLEFDHIDPSTKAFDIAGVLSRAWNALVEEAAKCQLLCKPCHADKGAEDRPPLQHGTLYVYSYWRCRCAPCKAANARKSAADRARKAAATPSQSPTPRVKGRSRSAYNRAWRQARRDRLIEMLGGKCVRCGSEDNLEFDHIDPSTKIFVVGAELDRAWTDLVEEAAKTQLLCKPCHVAKGAKDRPPLRHGTYYVYWYWNCRCDLCRASNNRKSAALAAKKMQRTAGPMLILVGSVAFAPMFELNRGSGGRTRTYDKSVNSRSLCQLSYAGSWLYAVFSELSVTSILVKLRSMPLTCDFSRLSRSDEQSFG